MKLDSRIDEIYNLFRVLEAFASRKAERIKGSVTKKTDAILSLQNKAI